MLVGNQRTRWSNRRNCTVPLRADWTSLPPSRHNLPRAVSTHLVTASLTHRSVCLKVEPSSVSHSSVLGRVARPPAGREAGAGQVRTGALLSETGPDCIVKRLSRQQLKATYVTFCRFTCTVKRWWPSDDRRPIAGGKYSFPPYRRRFNAGFYQSISLIAIMRPDRAG